MKSEFWRRAFKSIRARMTDGTGVPEEVLQVARDHHAKDFPNPLREGCAPYQVRLSAFRSGAMPSAEERAHILTCSDCYSDYQTALTAYRATAKDPENAGWRLPRLQIAIPAVASAIVLMVIGIAIYTARGPRESGTPPYINSTAQASPLHSPTASISVKSGDNEPTPERPPTETLAAVHRMTIDFENARTLRRRAPAENPIIKLTPVRQILFINLPEGSPRGPYEITLNGPFGEPVKSQSARSGDGKRLRVDFNLVGLQPGRYSICVTRAQEAPSCLPVTVAAN